MPHHRSTPQAVRIATAAALAAFAAAALPTTAQADSIVFVKDANIWLAAPDGSKLTQVTTDGTPEFPYHSPSQADDGTIAAGHRLSIVRLKQNGDVINTLDPPPLVNSVSQTVDGTPVDVAITPDGTKIAYTFVSSQCPIGADCDTRPVTGITNANAFTPPGTYATALYGSPRWVGNNRLLVTGGYLHHINLVDAAPGSPTVHWFDDQEFFGDSSDMGFGDVSRDGKRVVAVHGYDGDREATIRRLIWFNSSVDARTSSLPPAKPTAVCVTGPERGTLNPTWSADGTRLAWQTPAGIEVSNAAPTEDARCPEFSSSVVFPGGSSPDWGPADVNPGPKTMPPGGGGQQQPGPGGSGQPSGGQGGTAGIVVESTGAPKLSKALRKGVRVRVTGLTAKQSVRILLGLDAKTSRRYGLGKKATTIASGKATTSSAGAATVTVKFTAAAKKKLRRAKSLKPTVKVDGTARGTLSLK